MIPACHPAPEESHRHIPLGCEAENNGRSVTSFSLQHKERGTKESAGGRWRTACNPDGESMTNKTARGSPAPNKRMKRIPHTPSFYSRYPAHVSRSEDPTPPWPVVDGIHFTTDTGPEERPLLPVSALQIPFASSFGGSVGRESCQLSARLVIVVRPFTFGPNPRDGPGSVTQLIRSRTEETTISTNVHR